MQLYHAITRESCPSRPREGDGRRIRPRRERPLGMLSDGLSYKCSVETCPGRLQTCFCNAEPRILASQGAHLSSLAPSLSLSLALIFSFLPRVDVLLDDGRPCTIESFRFYGTAIVGVIHVEIRYMHYAAREKERDFQRLKGKLTISLQSVSRISNIKS